MLLNFTTTVSDLIDEFLRLLREHKAIGSNGSAVGLVFDCATATLLKEKQI